MIRALFILILFLPLLAWAQPATPRIKSLGEEAKGIVYSKEFVVQFQLHTQGLGAGVQFGHLATYYRTRFFSFDLAEIKHPKEFRQSFDFRTPSAGRISRSFVYGKQNSLFVLHGAFGEKRYFSDKALNRGLAIGVSYSGGPALGLLKPYHLDIIRYREPDFTTFFVRSEAFSPDNADRFLDLNSIYGASGFFRGIEQISVAPGAHAKVAVHLDWGAFERFVKAAEAGVMIDFFFRDMPIMIESPQTPNTENQRVFVNLFVNLQFGKRT